MVIQLSHLDTPVGRILIAATANGLNGLDFAESDEHVRARLEKTFPGATFSSGPFAKAAAKRVAAYFDGDLKALDALDTAAVGTAFQKKVWAALRKIPMGATASYAQIARAIGNPAAVRAVGAANGRNPVALVVPCHRVIGADGSLTGYASGLWRKQWLLQHERALLA